MSVEAASAGAMPREHARDQAEWWFAALPLLAGALAFAWILLGQLRRMYGLTGDAWDLAYYQQLVWSISQGHGFDSGLARTNSLGIHLDLILALPAAIERFWPSPVVLLLFSSAGLAATAPSAYLFLRAILPAERSESPWLALALSTPIPFWAAIQDAARDFFHPENLALPLALLAAWAGIRGHRVAMWCLCVATLACSETQIYTVVLVSLLVWNHGAPSLRRHAPFILFLAGGWFLVGTGIVQPLFRDFSQTVSAYAWLTTADPIAVAQAAARPAALLTAGVVLASLFALPVLAPRWLLLAVPPYLAAVLSDQAPQNTLSGHYVLALVFPLVVAAGIGARSAIERLSFKPALGLIAIVPALLLGWGTGRFPPALDVEPNLDSKPIAVAELRAAASEIPGDAPVSADSGLLVWLANRRTIGDFPRRVDPGSYVVVDGNMYVTSSQDRTARQHAIDALQGSRSLIYDDGRFEVWGPVGD